ncbi:hypothetical protein OSB04_018070 [Centaurea solstitialis]|uniref:Integrase catalytic domain-containing protein n=1 Tax=Centaurea solstitialis TaxID=347529 RepID=A0AA38T431_9ASTR|nr:hypothetical protein OSB04_018070 [Centaurea solstitialis]
MSSSSATDSLFSMNTAMHLITIRLPSTNYLLWQNQILPLLTYQNLVTHVDGSSLPPATEITAEGKRTPNPAYAEWIAADQRAVILIQSSLSEEAFSEIVGLRTARQIWVALEAAYCNSSVERIQNLQDQLRLMSKGTTPVSEFGRKFKSICDQLSAIGHPINENDKVHWFLCGLGATFETFSTAIRAAHTPINFRDLIAQAEGHELFLKSLHGSSPPAVAFSADSRAVSSNPARGRGGRNPRGGRGRGRRGRGRRPPHCQLCRTNGHYASACPKLATFASHAPTSDTDLARAFHAQCHVTSAAPDWYVDSGASDHMTASSASVTKPTPYLGNNQVSFGNGNVLPISHIGQSSLSNRIRLRDVLVVPRISKNLLSVSKLTTDNNLDVLFSQPHFYIQDRTTRKVLAQGICDRGLYVPSTAPQACLASSRSTSHASFELWHSRLGHVSFSTILLLNKEGHLSVTSILPKPIICNSCQLAKSHRLPFIPNEKRASRVLDLIHCDLWGHRPNVRLMAIKTKSEFSIILDVFLKFVQTQFSRKLKVFQSDGGTEFLNNRVTQILVNNGTFHRISCPYTPQQNGRAERKHRHIVETGLAMLFNGHVPPTYWVHAFRSAVYIINRLPTPVLQNKSPFELLFKRCPSYGHLRPFGCRVYPYLRDYAANKLSPRSLPCIFIGYCSQYKGYQCLEPTTSRIYVTRHAKFDEHLFPFTDTGTHTSRTLLPLSQFSDECSASIAPSPFMDTSPAPPIPCDPCGDETSSPTPVISVSFPTDLSPPPTPSASTNVEPDQTPLTTTPTHPDPATVQSITAIDATAPATIQSTPVVDAIAPVQPTIVPTTGGHPMQTRAKSGIFKPKHRVDLAHTTISSALFAATDPRSFKTAVKHPLWVTAMKKEMEALRRNQTWTLVPRPPHHNVVGSKWLYHTKYRADGSVERYKARLVAQGFSQIPGLDFSQTFSPVVKASTVRVVLSLAVINQWKLHQLDVNNAFLNGNLNELVFMEQPPGFLDASRPDHVCRLNKALYGLKQAPRAWFLRLSNFLVANGFVCSRADTSLFVFKRDSCILYLLVYVDDLIITGSDDQLIRRFIDKLHAEFAIKDLGRLNFFLGLEYARDILERARLLDSKPVATPLAANIAFTTSGDLFHDPTHYRSLVGALQYLTITRPDISYAVNQVSQFLQAPTVPHFQAVIRILRYVKGTMSYGLHFTRTKSTNILGYSDADWARCLETRRSTYGYSIFLGGNLVSWSAKKQPTVSRSSCESEYRAMANTTAEIVWLTHLLRELHALPPARPTFLCDNKSALFLTQNPVSHKRAKHIDLDYHFVRELVASGKLHTRFDPTKLQVADIFTKSLPRHQFEFFRELLLVRPPPSRLRGDIRYM